MERSERAKYVREGRALQREIKRDEFLQEMLVAAEESNAFFAAQKISREEYQLIAKADGYRSSNAWIEMRKDAHAAIRHFVQAEAFQRLWNLLRSHDGESFGYAYSPVQGGVPMRILSAIEVWHKAPQLTGAERRAHSKRIAKISAELEILIAQLVPSEDLDDQYSRFRFEDEGQVSAVFAAFEFPTDQIKSGLSWNLSQRLRLCGLDPLWAVKNIQKAALSRTLGHSSLPTKIRAAAAKKTYFIRAIGNAIRMSTMSDLESLKIGPQLMADIAGLVSNMDCTADDVRKELANHSED